MVGNKGTLIFWGYSGTLGITSGIGFQALLVSAFELKALGFEERLWGSGLSGLG